MTAMRRSICLAVCLEHDAFVRSRQEVASAHEKQREY